VVNGDKCDTWQVLVSWKHSIAKCLLHVLQYGRLRQREHKPPYAMWATPQLEQEATNTYANYTFTYAPPYTHTHTHTHSVIQTKENDRQN